MEPPDTLRIAPNSLWEAASLLCGEESRPVATLSVPPALVLVSCSSMGSEFLDGVPSLALRG